MFLMIINLSALATVKMKCNRSLKLIFLTLYTAVIIVVDGQEECGIINEDQYRNDRKTTEIDEFPWMGRVAFNNLQDFTIEFYCQAMLITQKQLLSAAHCFRDSPRHEPFAVALGDWDTTNNLTEDDCNAVGICSRPVLIDIAEIVIHPFYNFRRRENDISLLRLTQAVTFTDFIRPICLPTKEYETIEFGSEELMLTGWLRKKEGHLRHKMPVIIFNIQDCRRKLVDYNLNITDSYLCGIACVGKDVPLSGSALMDVKQTDSMKLRANLVGIVVFGEASCGNRIPDVMMRIDRYLDWIKTNIY